MSGVPVGLVVGAMRSLVHCRGCGDAVYNSAPGNWRGLYPHLAEHSFCPDQRRAESTPRVGCVRLAARQDQSFRPLLESLERNTEQRRQHWQKLAKVAAFAVVLSPLGVQAKKPAKAGPLIQTCATKDPWSCGGSPSRCDCSGKVCKCVIVVSMAAVCPHCTPRSNDCRGGSVCSCSSGGGCCE